MLVIRWILSIGALLTAVAGIGVTVRGCIKEIKNINSVGNPGAVSMIVGATLIFLGTIAVIVLGNLNLWFFN